MKRLVRTGRMWVGFAALSLGLGFSTNAYAGHGSSGGSSGGSHGSSGGGGRYFLRGGSSGGSSGGYSSHGSSGGTGGGVYRPGGDDGVDEGPPGPLDNQSTRRSSSNSSDTVLLTIFVPADAKLYIEDQPTQLTGTRREFISPKLPKGKEFIYTLKAAVEKGSQKVTGKEEVTVKAGDHATVEFGPSDTNPDELLANRR
jgi:uncharacterized protein (TIGR03000 family)